MSLKYRPFAVMGFSSLTVLLSCVFVSEKLSVVFIALGVMIFIFSVAFERIRDQIFPFYIAAALLLSGILYSAVNENNLKYAQSFIDENVEIEGVVTDEPSFSNSRYYYLLDLDTIDGKKLNSKLRLSLPNDIGAQAYDTIKLKVTIYEIAAENREIQLYYQSKGIFLGAYAYNSEDFDIEITKRADDSFSYKIYLLRQEINRRILDKLPNENGATVIAMLLGDKTNLPDELNEKFREVGIAPIFAVSGLHLSVWVMGLYSLLSRLGVRKRLNSIIGIVFTVFFMFLTALSPSVCRAGFMMLLLLSGNLFYRKTDSLNSLGFAAFILCAINPYIVADSGFLMSFSATLGIVTLMPLADKHILSKIPVNIIGSTLKSFLSIIAVSVCASVGVFPITVFFVGYISVFSVLSNVLVTYAATLCMFLGGLTAITYNVGFISDFVSILAGLLSKYLIWVVELICSIPVTTVSTDNIFWKSGVVLSLAVVIFSLLCFKKNSLAKAISVGLSAVILFTSVSSYLYFDGLTQIRILNVGNGVSCVIFNDDKKIVLSGSADGYYKTNEIIDNLNQISRKPTDLLLLGDVDGADDSANLDLINNIDFEKIVVPNSSQSLDIVAETDDIFETENAYIEVWDNGAVEFYSDEDCTLAYCTFNNLTVLVLFDSAKKAEVPKKYLTADYLVCSGYIPGCISPSVFERVILCGTSEVEQSVYDYVLSCGGNPLNVYEYESVRINIRDDKNRIFVMEG